MFQVLCDTCKQPIIDINDGIVEYIHASDGAISNVTVIHGLWVNANCSTLDAKIGFGHHDLSSPAFDDRLLGSDILGHPLPYRTSSAVKLISKV